MKRPPTAVLRNDRSSVSVYPDQRVTLCVSKQTRQGGIAGAYYIHLRPGEKLRITAEWHHEPEDRMTNAPDDWNVADVNGHYRDGWEAGSVAKQAEIVALIEGLVGPAVTDVGSLRNEAFNDALAAIQEGAK